MTDKILQILNKEVVQAQGCTEPVALAYGCAKLTQVLGTVPEKIDVYLSSNLVKNIKSVLIPGTDGMFGIESAAALGAVAGNPSKVLMVIADVTPADMEKVKKYIAEQRITAHKIEGDAKLHMRVVGAVGRSKASVEIKDYHTNIVKIMKDDELISESTKEAADTNADSSFLNIKTIYDFVKHADLTPFKSILEKIEDLNCAISNEGLKNNYGVRTGKIIANEGTLRAKVVGRTAAASDARMGGAPFSVVSICGSGNQGIATSLPVIVYGREKEMGDEKILRGLLFSILTLVHIKNHVGRLSPFCGAVCGAAASFASIAFMKDMSYQQISYVIENVIATLVGMVCDGAKASCAVKIAASVNSGYDALLMAECNLGFAAGEGIVGKDVENTLDKMMSVVQDGMINTDDVILDVMLDKINYC